MKVATSTITALRLKPTLIASTTIAFIFLIATSNDNACAFDEESESTSHEGTIRESIEKSLSLLESSSAISREERQCFTCHHQAMPTLALTLASQQGIEIDQENYDAQVQHSLDHLERGKERYLKSEGQGGGVDTAGYALWTLRDGMHPPDETTHAVVGYLLDKQNDQGYWKCSSNRPPSEVSHFTTTFLALYGLDGFAGDDDREEVNEAIRSALNWLATQSPIDTEDHVFRLMSLVEFSDGDDTAELAKSTIEVLLSQQNEDGGWGQTSDMESDAYATGQVLHALVVYGGLTVKDESYRRGIQFLLRSQNEDGSWHVVSRSKPFQTYFESGFPHGKDQFISCSATSWATMALLHALPVEPIQAASEEADETP